MLTAEELNKELASVRNGLVADISVARERATKGREATQKKAEYERNLTNYNTLLSRYKAAGNHILHMFKNMKHYVIQHREQAKAILDLAIEEAGALVPDAESAGVYLKQTDDNRVIVVDKDGFNVNLVEGGGYRASLGIMLRYAALSVQPDALPLLLMDEYFFTMSDETLSALHPRLEEIKKKMSIICIEQRRCAMAGIVDDEYAFKKGADKNTVVSKVV